MYRSALTFKNLTKCARSFNIVSYSNVRKALITLRRNFQENEAFRYVIGLRASCDQEKDHIGNSRMNR
jgi:hypothetical protein